VATSRPVRIPRSAPPLAGAAKGESRETPPSGPPGAWRPNVGGSQRAFRVTVLYLVVLAALYVAFVLYDRTAPGGSASPETNGVLLFTGIFAVFGVLGLIVTLTPAPRGVEVATDRIVVVGRWGRRRTLPALERLSFRAVRRYPAGWLADTPVELIEIWGRGTPMRSYLVDSTLFAGAALSDLGR